MGAARTAFYNWLFARRNKGKFILRIEDTDYQRSSEEMSKGILEGLQWLGLDWDQGPIFQSGRIELYRTKAEELVQKGDAYYCYCLPEEIAERKKDMSLSGEYPGYDRYCLNLTERERERFEQLGRQRAIRFKVPPGKAEYTDAIHGDISVDYQVIEDFVLIRRNGLPTYHLSVVVDDIDQHITHVIRGDDHISNTPKQVLLYKAFDSKPPGFAHQALLLGPDKKKLSKRHGVTSINMFRKQGYLPLALLNYLARMNWLPGDDPRIYSLEEMIPMFSLKKLSKASPVFDTAKLDWMNKKMIENTGKGVLLPLVEEELKRKNLWTESLNKEKSGWFLKLVELYKGRSRTVSELAENMTPFLKKDISYDPEGVQKHLSDERLYEGLHKLRDDFLRMTEFSAEKIEEVLRKKAEKEGLKAAVFIHALRMLVTGMMKSPGIFEVLELAGKDLTIERMNKFPSIFV